MYDFFTEQRISLTKGLNFDCLHFIYQILVFRESGLKSKPRIKIVNFTDGVSRRTVIFTCPTLDACFNKSTAIRWEVPTVDRPSISTISSPIFRRPSSSQAPPGTTKPTDVSQTILNFSFYIFKDFICNDLAALTSSTEMPPTRNHSFLLDEAARRLPPSISSSAELPSLPTNVKPSPLALLTNLAEISSPFNSAGSRTDPSIQARCNSFASRNIKNDELLNYSRTTDVKQCYSQNHEFKLENDNVRIGYFPIGRQRTQFVVVATIFGGLIFVGILVQREAISPLRGKGTLTLARGAGVCSFKYTEGIAVRPI
uniref:Uncharacterized protein n=1 Tax=Romanomermis culicivorax TaxID=13658 RepID=A0A915I3C8_ROMCU